MNLLREFWRSCRRGERVFFLAAGLPLAFMSGWLWQEQRASQTLPPLFEDAPALRPTTGKVSSPNKRILVHVAGAVKKSGVLALPSSCRVRDAIRAAGGATNGAALDSLNLAAPLEDGAKVLVLTRQELRAQNQAERQDTAPPKRRPQVLRPINVNTATSAELEQLPGIGPSLAQRIIAYRKQRMRIQSLDDLDQVKGLGPKKLEKLRPWLRF
jgi:competence protein ComEA